MPSGEIPAPYSEFAELASMVSTQTTPPFAESSSLMIKCLQAQQQTQSPEVFPLAV